MRPDTVFRSLLRLSVRLPLHFPVCRAVAEPPLRLHAAATRGLAALAVSLAVAGACAQDYAAGDIRITHVYATPTPPGARIGAAYLSARNQGSQDDRLIGAASPAAARVEVHNGEIGTDGVMRMREIEAVPMPAGSTTGMKPGGGEHLMLMDLARPLVAGESFPMTLEFERGGKVEVRVAVEAPKDGSAQHKHGAAH